MALAIGLVGGWLTAATGGIGAAFLGHAITRFAVFLCTGHAGQTKPRGREDEEIEKRRRTPEGWRVIGSRESVNEARRTGRRRRSRPRPPVALYVHVPFCVSLCPYCDFVVYAGAAARGPRARIDAFVAALEVELDAARRRPRRGLRADAAAARDALPGRRHAVAAAGRRRRATPRARIRERFGLAAERRDHARGQPRAGRARRSGGAGRAPASRGCRSARRPLTTRCCSASAGATRRATSPTPSPRRGRPGSVRSASTSCTTCPARRRWRLDGDARRGPRARRPTTCRCTR